MKCPNCGEMIKEKKKMNFCGFCGSNLKTGEKTLTAPVSDDDIIPESTPVKSPAFSAPEPAPAAPVNTAGFSASPFEQMAMETAVSQGIGGFQTTITPPSFDSAQTVVPVPDFSVPSPVLPAEQAPVTKAPEPVAPAAEPAPAPASPLGSFDPSSLSAFDPYKAQEAAAKANADFMNYTPLVKPVQAPAAEAPKPFVPAAEPAPAPAASPLGSFDPSSLSAFDPYKAQQDAVKKEETPKLSMDNPEAIKAALNKLAEETSRPFEPAAEEVKPAEEVKSEPEAKAASPEIKRTGYQGINISKNVKIRTSSDDSDSAPITYMEYTKSTDTDEETAENKYSAFSFASPANQMPAQPEPASEEETKEEEAGPQAVFTEYKPSINLSKESDTPAPAEEPAAAPEPVKAPEPVPEPEPEPVKEKVINYVGQEKKAAEQMISFKGLVAEIEYAEDEKEYNFVIAQSIPADTEVLPGTVIRLTVSAGTWSAWEENPMPVSSANYITETRTECRKKSRTRSTDKKDTTDTSEYEDYTLVGQDTKYSDWEVDQYYSSEAIPPGPTCEIVRVASGFKYAGWFNPANMNGMSFSSPDVANFFNTNLSNVKWTYEEIISEENIKPDVKNWKLVTDDMNSTPAGDPMVSNIFFSAHVVEGKSYAMKFGSAESEWYVYKKRNVIETVYHFEKEIISDWSEWSEWSETEFTASEDCQVEKRVLSRSKRKIPTA